MTRISPFLFSALLAIFSGVMLARYSTTGAIIRRFELDPLKNFETILKRGNEDAESLIRKATEQGISAKPNRDFGIGYETVATRLLTGGVRNLLNNRTIKDFFFPGDSDPVIAGVLKNVEPVMPKITDIIPGNSINMVPQLRNDLKTIVSSLRKGSLDCASIAALVPALNNIVKLTTVNSKDYSSFVPIIIKCLSNSLTIISNNAPSWICSSAQELQENMKTFADNTKGRTRLDSENTQIVEFNALLDQFSQLVKRTSYNILSNVDKDFSVKVLECFQTI